MKKTFITTLAALAAITSTAVAQPADTAASTEISQSMENSQYIETFGMMMFDRNGLSDLNLTAEEFDMLVAGMRKSFSGESMPENIQEIGPKMLQYLSARAEANIAKVAAKSEEASAGFWSDLDKIEGINKMPSGLAYEIIAEGDGNYPKEDSTVVVKYTGKLTDGTVFDSTDKHGGQPATFPLAQVIPGFREGLQKVAKGGKARLYIPGKLGYGNQPVPGIPVNSTLIFDVEIVDIDPAQ